MTNNYTHFAAVVLCSRPESKRIPRKVFKNIADRPAIWHILNRMKSWKYPFILAVPYLSNEYDFLIKEFPYVKLCFGNPDSPLHRIKDVLDYSKIKPKWIVRITHDDILIDINTIYELLTECNEKIGCGYGISPTIVDGAGVEVFRYDNLEFAYNKRKDPTEFVSYFVKSFPYSNIYKHKPRRSIERNYRLTMDYPEDATVLNMILSQTGIDASLDKIVEYIDQHSYIMNINRLPDVSIYTCAYNSEDYVKDTIVSILNTDPSVNFEYIFIDDKSTDKTIIEASKYSQYQKIKFHINDSNEGLSSSCNKAIDMSKGQYIIRVDADDQITPRTIKCMQDKIKESQSGIVYSSYSEMDKFGRIYSDIIKPNINHHAGCALMDKRLINEIRFTTGLRNWDSLDIYNRIKDMVPISYYDDEPLWYYRRGHNSLSQSDTEKRKKEFNFINNKN